MLLAVSLIQELPSYEFLCDRTTFVVEKDLWSSRVEFSNWLGESSFDSLIWNLGFSYSSVFFEFDGFTSSSQQFDEFGIEIGDMGMNYQMLRGGAYFKHILTYLCFYHSRLWYSSERQDFFGAGFGLRFLKLIPFKFQEIYLFAGGRDLLYVFSTGEFFGTFEAGFILLDFLVPGFSVPACAAAEFSAGQLFIKGGCGAEYIIELGKFTLKPFLHANFGGALIGKAGVCLEGEFGDQYLSVGYNCGYSASFGSFIHTVYLNFVRYFSGG